MEKSIENIWTKGFLDSKELVIPKIENFYNQKSKIVLEKIKKTYKSDNNATIPIALLLGIGFGLYGKYLLAFYVMALLFSLYFFNRNLLKSLESIQLIDNTHDYLISYRKKVNKIIAITTRLLGFLYPVAILIGIWLFFRDTEMYIKIIEKVSGLKFSFYAFGIALLFSILSISVYRLTTYILYGKYLAKLDDIILDLKELKK